MQVRVVAGDEGGGTLAVAWETFEKVQDSFMFSASPPPPLERLAFFRKAAALFGAALSLLHLLSVSSSSLALLQQRLSPADVSSLSALCSRFVSESTLSFASSQPPSLFAALAAGELIPGPGLASSPREDLDSARGLAAAGRLSTKLRAAPRRVSFPDGFPCTSRLCALSAAQVAAFRRSSAASAPDRKARSDDLCSECGAADSERVYRLSAMTASAKDHPRQLLGCDVPGCTKWSCACCATFLGLSSDDPMACPGCILLYVVAREAKQLQQGEGEGEGLEEEEDEHDEADVWESMRSTADAVEMQRYVERDLTANGFDASVLRSLQVLQVANQSPACVALPDVFEELRPDRTASYTESTYFLLLVDEETGARALFGVLISREQTTPGGFASISFLDTAGDAVGAAPGEAGGASKGGKPLRGAAMSALVRAYMHAAALRGFRKVCFWVCHPRPGESYVIPHKMRYRLMNLRQWYLTLLREASAEGVGAGGQGDEGARIELSLVRSFRTLAESFEAGELSAATMPFFDKDILHVYGGEILERFLQRSSSSRGEGGREEGRTRADKKKQKEQQSAHSAAPERDDEEEEEVAKARAARAALDERVTAALRAKLEDLSEDSGERGSEHLLQEYFIVKLSEQTRLDAGATEGTETYSLDAFTDRLNFLGECRKMMATFETREEAKHATEMLLSHIRSAAQLVVAV